MKQNIKEFQQQIMDGTLTVKAPTHLTIRRSKDINELLMRIESGYGKVNYTALMSDAISRMLRNLEEGTGAMDNFLK